MAHQMASITRTSYREHRGRPGAIRRRLTDEELHDQIAHIVVSSTERQLANMLNHVDADAYSIAAKSIHKNVNAARGIGSVIPTSSRAMAAVQRGEQFDQARFAMNTELTRTLS